MRCWAEHFFIRLLMEIEKHKTIILIGETGSGKTTQIPQYIHELKMESDGIVGITQVLYWMMFYWLVFALK